MLKYLIFIILLITPLLAHEGHRHDNQHPQKERSCAEGRPSSWTQWVGSLHLGALHFPIALIMLTPITELLFKRCNKRIFDEASRFMIITAAITAPLTAILGFVYSYSAPYTGLLEIYIKLHLIFGIATACLAIFTAWLREREGIGKIYYSALIVLFLLVSVTSYFGGGLSFGPYVLFPPC